MSTKAWEVGRGVVVTVLSAAVISSAVSLYRISSNFAPIFGGVPDGAIVAFGSSECPAGWAAYGRGEGRFIVGAGAHSEHNTYGNPVPSKVVGDIGGEDQVMLAIEHLPSHRHNNPTEGFTPKGGTSALLASDNGFPGDDNNPHGRPTAYVGGNQPHDNMPPYVALLYCEKGQ